VHGANDIRTAQDENLAAIFFAPEVIESGIALLDVAAHGGVVNDGALGYGLEEITHQDSVTLSNQRFGDSVEIGFLLVERIPLYSRLPVYKQMPPHTGPALDSAKEY
jgi:hypothetical protein